MRLGPTPEDRPQISNRKLTKQVVTTSSFLLFVLFPWLILFQTKALGTVNSAPEIVKQPVNRADQTRQPTNQPASYLASHPVNTVIQTNIQHPASHINWTTTGLWNTFEKFFFQPTWFFFGRSYQMQLWSLEDGNVAEFLLMLDTTFPNQKKNKLIKQKSLSVLCASSRLLSSLCICELWI